MTSRLFEPIAIGDVELPNRLVVAPMCQYSANDGSATDWHLQHLSQLGYSGAGLVVVEATAVERRGRITHACLGLYSDDNESALERVTPLRTATRRPHAMGHSARTRRSQSIDASSVGRRRTARPRRRRVADRIVERDSVRRRLACPARSDCGRDRRDRGRVRPGRATRRAHRVRGDRNPQRTRLSPARVPVAARERTHR